MDMIKRLNDMSLKSDFTYSIGIKTSLTLAWRAVVFCLLTTAVTSLHAQASTNVPENCSIFTATCNDTILFGNNEDGADMSAYVLLQPQEGDKYASLSFGSEYDFYGFFIFLGGMNETGLVVDNNSVEPRIHTSHPEKETFHNLPAVSLTRAILDYCSSVEEAIALAESFNWEGGVPHQTHIADAQGDAVVISVDESGEWAFTRKPPHSASPTYLASTNFNVADGDPGNCWRYTVLTEQLSQIENESQLTLANAQILLSAVSQPPLGSDNPTNTIYSYVAMPKEMMLYLYFFKDWSNGIEIDVADLLATTEQREFIQMSRFFEDSIIEKAIEHAKQADLNDLDYYYDYLNEEDHSEPIRPEWTYENDFSPSDTAENGVAQLGSEITQMAVFDGSIFAASRTQLGNESGQIVRKDAQADVWYLDYELPDQMDQVTAMMPVTLTTDKNGNSIDPVSLLITAPSNVVGDFFLCIRNTEGDWSKNLLEHSDDNFIISGIGIAQHTDRITHVDKVIVSTANRHIYGGAYNAQTQQLEWTKEVDTLDLTRVGRFAESNGHLYIACFDTIYVRNDGPSPSWRPVWDIFMSLSGEGPLANRTGILGLTSIPEPDGSDALLFFVANNIYRMDPAADHKVALELPLALWFLEQYPQFEPKVMQAATNGFMPVPLPGRDQRIWLAGLRFIYDDYFVNTYPNTEDLPLFTMETGLPYFGTLHWNTSGFFLVRDEFGHYSLEKIPSEDAMLMHPRAMVVSPFEEDEGASVYMGGFDSSLDLFLNHDQPEFANAAWIYKANLSAPPPVEPTESGDCQCSVVGAKRSSWGLWHLLTQLSQ